MRISLTVLYKTSSSLPFDSTRSVVPALLAALLVLLLAASLVLLLAASLVLLLAALLVLVVAVLLTFLALPDLPTSLILASIASVRVDDLTPGANLPAFRGRHSSICDCSSDANLPKGHMGSKYCSTNIL